VQSVQTKNVTAELLFDSSVKPWCSRKKKGKAMPGMIFVSSLSEEVQLLVNESIPWIVREYPEKFPFLVPGHLKHRLSTLGVLSQTLDPNWRNLC
jgi:hypothetical protein